jgi:hypothetical protein
MLCGQETDERLVHPPVTRDTYAGIAKFLRMGAIFGGFLLTQAAGVAPQSVVTLKLIDARSGKPLRNAFVGMDAYNGPSPHRFPDYRFPGSGILPTTSADGRISFRLPEPTPEYIGFGLGYPNFWGCSQGLLLVSEILKSGVVATYDERKCGKLKKGGASAKPGEVVIYERVFSRWDWFRQELP